MATRRSRHSTALRLAALVAALALAAPDGAVAAPLASRGHESECERTPQGEVCTERLLAPSADPLPRPSIAELQARVDAAAVALGGGTTTVNGGSPEVAATPGIACAGNGVDGHRVQAVYVYYGSGDRYSKIAPYIRTWAAQVDRVLRVSSTRLGGYRRVRWVTNSDCVLRVLKVRLTSAARWSFSTFVSQMRAKGFTRSDRVYLSWFDSGTAQGACGIGEHWYDSDPGPTNVSNRGGRQALAYAPCWGQSRYIGYISTEAHELMHMLGAVDYRSPHATYYGGHCYDEWDIMCYYDGGPSMRYRCSTTTKNQLDCNGDDYFNPNPRAGSWLATHWNTARSSFLTGTDVAAPTVTPPTYATSWYEDGGYLEWDATDDQLIVRSDLQQRIDGTTWTSLGSTTLTYRSLTLAQTPPGHTYEWRVRAMDSAGRFSEWATSEPLTITPNAPPSVSTGEPAVGAYDQYGGTWALEFPWTASDSDGSIYDLRAELSADGGATWTPWSPGWWSGSSGAVQVDGIPGVVYQVRLRAQDDRYAWSDWVVSAPLTAPPAPPTP